MRGLACLRKQFTFAAFVDAAQQGHIIFRHRVETDDRQQSILLRTADDHACDDVENADGVSQRFRLIMIRMYGVNQWGKASSRAKSGGKPAFLTVL